jgi:hypothetical protein
MRKKDAEPEECRDCGHLVYPVVVVPVRRLQQSCRALIWDPSGEERRCGCESFVHRLPTTRPRHRLSATD